MHEYSGSVKSGALMRDNEGPAMARRLGAIPLTIACLTIGSGSALADGGMGGGGSWNGGAAGGVDSIAGAGGAGADGFPLGAGGGGGAGATGGNGGNGNSPGGVGGAGGAGATVAGGNGEDGQIGDWEIGGGGGGGAHGEVVTTGGAIGPLTGGNGGNGGGNSQAGVGGGGGAGGFGASVSSAVPVSTLGDIFAGDGGAGGGASDAYHGGGGGSGGIGIAFGASGSSLVNGFTIQAGSGGAGGTALVDASSTGGAGGNGGSGVSGSDLTITNTGSIIGGNGGSGGTGMAQSGAHGAGGAGVVGSGLAITTSGTISGGLGGDGSTRANALTLLGGANSLTLQSGWSLTGDIATGGTDTTLTFGLDGIDATVANTITGSAAVVVDVAGHTLALTGSNTYMGGTTVSGGTLLIDSNGALGDAAGGVTLSNGGVLKWNATFGMNRNFTLGTGGGVIDTGGQGPVTLSGDITGSGGLTVRAGSRVDLSGTNDYTGATLIEDGTLRISSNTALNSTTALTVDAGATLEINGFLRQVSVGSIAGDGLITGSGGVLQFFVWGTDDTDTTFDGTIDGDTIFASKQGTGTTTLTGTNDFQSFVVNEGAIKIGAGGVLGARTDLTLFGTSKLDLDGHSIGIDSLIGDATALVSFGSGTLTLDHAAGSIHYFGAIEGTGGIVKEGAGTQVLAGDNRFTGDTAVNEGTLQIGAGADAGTFTGDVSVAAGATFAFNRTGETTYGGALSGAGDFAKQGAGVVTLTGDSSGFTGTTTVSAGTLLVGSGGAGALGGTVEVELGGTLGGSGTISGNATVDGTLAAGNSPGTLTFEGNLTLESGSTTKFELNGPGVVGGPSNDHIVVEGALALDGTLEASVAAGGFYGLFDYGSRSGGFADVEVSGTGGFTVASSSLEFGIPNQINLAVLGVGQTLQFWDGTDMTGNGTIDGGTGTWNAGNTNWTGAPGSADINGPWLGSVGVFLGTAGTVTVSGTQSFDTLQFKTDGYEVTGGTLAIAPATGSTGTLSVDGDVTVTIGSAIADGSGPAGLAKVGGGTVVLTGLNTYSGGTSITGGTLSVSADANLGAASGGLTIGGGTLATKTSFTSQRAVKLTGAAGIDVGFATTLTLAGTISGAGGLVKLDYGTLVLSGANTYEGGTLFANGIVEVASDGNLGAASGGLGFEGGMLATTASFASARNVEVAGAGGLDVAAGTVLSLAGTVSGAGILAKLGGGDLVLSGASDIEWNVQAGGLTADAALFTGDVSIASGAGFTFDQKVDAAYAGTLSGFGAFTKTGAAALSFTGDGSAFSGATTVAQGLLAVNGTLGGVVDVLNGGTLGGAGTVGPVSVASGGTVAPGNSPGTLHVAGDISFASGSTYEVEIAGSGASDLITASGQAIIEGGTVEVNALDPRASYVTGQSFTILTAEGGVDGSFDAAVSGTPFLVADLGATGDSVTLTIAVDQAFTAAALTPNQFATAAAMDTLPQFGPTLGLYNALLFLPSYASARAALDQLSGDVHASVQSLFIQDSVFTRRTVTDRLRAAFGGVGASSAPVVSYAPATGTGTTEAGMALKAVVAPATTGTLALWATGYGAWIDMDGHANAAGLTSDTGGFLIGADAPVAAGWRLGVVGGYGYTSFDFDGRNASGSSDDWTISAYAGNQWGALGLRTGLAYTWQDVESSRSVAFEGFADQLKADYDAGTFQVFGELGYRIETGFVAFEPFAGLAYVSLDTSGFGETGGAAALTASGSDMDTTFTTLGIRLAKEVTIGSLAATLRGTVGWQHAFGDVTPRATQAFLGSIPFTVTGVPLAEDAALVEAGLDLTLTEATTLGFAYAGQFGDSTTQNSVNATLKVSF